MKQQQNGSNLVTKDFMEKKLTEFEIKLEGKFDKRFEQADEKARQYRDDVLNKFDEVIKELETTREDRELAVYQTREMRDQIEDHEKRIRKVEKTQAA